MSQFKLPIVLASMLLVAILAVFGQQTWQALRGKTQSQRDAVASIQQWVSSYQAIQPANVRFDQAYTPLQQARDLLSLHTLTRIEATGLQVAFDKVVLMKAEPVKRNDRDLGLGRFCLASGGGEELEVSAPSYAALFAGMHQLTQRADLEIGAIKVVGGGSQASARLAPFCLLLRTDTPALPDTTPAAPAAAAVPATPAPAGGAAPVNPRPV
jgi:hypothetical protein